MVIEGTVYLDHAGTTSMDPRVLEAMIPYFSQLYGNPSSIHTVGQEARYALDESRERVAQVLEAYGIRAPFLLSVGALCPRKNVEAIVETFEAARSLRPELKLVLVGEPAFGWEGSAGEVALRRCGNSVVLPGYLPRDALWCAYLSLIHI